MARPYKKFTGLELAQKLDDNVRLDATKTSGMIELIEEIAHRLGAHGYRSVMRPPKTPRKVVDDGESTSLGR